MYLFDNIIFHQKDANLEYTYSVVAITDVNVRYYLCFVGLIV